MLAAILGLGGSHDLEGGVDGRVTLGGGEVDDPVTMIVSDMGEFLAESPPVG